MAPNRLHVLKAKKMVMGMILIALPLIVHSQSALDPANANADNTVFYFDSNSNCNGPIRELYGFQATIRGNDLTSTRLGPLACSIILRSTGQFDGTVLDIEIKAMNILDQSTQVSIYDGDGTNLILMSYDYSLNQNLNKRRFFTTGDTATFRMTRLNVNSFNFDIEIKINPVRGSTAPGYENSFGSGYFFDKFAQTTIVGMIGGFYAVILVICISIILAFCCTYRTLDKKWEIQQLATIKPGAAFDTKSQPSNAWSVEMKSSKGPASQYSLDKTDPYSRKTVARSEDGDSGVIYNGDAFQNKYLVKAEKEKSIPRHASSNASFIEAEEDSDHFVEKIITPRVKSTNHRSKKPPAYEDAVSDHTSGSSDEESEFSSENSVKKRPLSSEERSDRSRSTCTESEAASESGSDRSRQVRGARAQRHKGKHQKSRRRYSDENDEDTSRPNHSHQQMLPPQLPTQPQIQQVPYGAYPPGAYPPGAYPPGQFVPVMVGPNQFQQVAMVPSFPPPNYSKQQAAAPPTSHIQPTDPPVYSYLVRRGYTPFDARSNSAASTARSQRAGAEHLQDPELRLDSGVEYMRR